MLIMRAAWLSVGVVCAGALYGQGPPASKPPAAPNPKVDFARDIEPLFAKRCQLCHGAQQQMSGLRLDQKEAALKGGVSGKDILPGDSAGSRLIHLVSGQEAKVMPPVGARLTPAEIALLRAWIDQGAVWPVLTT